MIVKLKEVKSADKVLQRILSTQLEQKLSYRISKIMNKLVPTLDKIDDTGNALVRKHGVVENGRYNVPPEKLEEYGKEFMEFLEDPTDINIDPLPFELLEKAGIKFSPEEMIILTPFITEPILEEVV